MAFAAGALVFPGGRIDNDDRGAAAGFAVSPTPPPGSPRSARRSRRQESRRRSSRHPVRVVAALRGDRARPPFDRLLADHGLAFALGALTPFARWCPNFRETRRFDTLFFLAKAPATRPTRVGARGRPRLLGGARTSSTRSVPAVPTPFFPPGAILNDSPDSFDREAHADAARHPVTRSPPGSRRWTAHLTSASRKVSAIR